MRHASSVCFRNRRLGIAITSQPGAARTPAITNEIPRNVITVNAPSPWPKISEPWTPKTYRATSNPAATTAPKDDRTNVSRRSNVKKAVKDNQPKD